MYKSARVQGSLKRFIVVLFAGLLAATAHAQSCATQPSGMVAWWAAEGNTMDQVSGQYGTIQGGVTYGHGEAGTGFVFDGNPGSAIQITNLAPFQLQDFTIECWMKRGDSNVTTHLLNFGSLFSSQYGGYAFGMWNGGSLWFGAVDSTGVSVSTGLNDTTQFHHVAVTKSGTNVVFYVDGVASAPMGLDLSGFPSPLVGGSGVLGIGGRPNPEGDSSFLGSIDELSVYSRALSSAEVLAIYDAGSAGKCLTLAPPSITGPPTNESAPVNGNVSFSVSATGTQPMAYQWFKDGNSISGVTGPLLTLNNLQGGDAGQYWVVVSNSFGSTNSAMATLTVFNNPPTITQQPTNEVVPLGSTATLSVAATGTGPFRYQWLCNGTNFPAAIITTIAGSGTNGYSGDGGAATSASLSGPDALAVDGAGNIFFMDSGNVRVRKIDTNGIITTVVGDGINGFSGDGRAAINASLSGPYVDRKDNFYAISVPAAGMTVDGAGNLFFSDAGNLRVRKVDTNGIITTVAGSGSYGGPVWMDNGYEQGYGGPGPTGDGGWATNAPFGGPAGLAVDAAGNLFIADSANDRLQCVDTNGVMMTAGSTGGYPLGVALDNLDDAFVPSYGIFGGGLTEVFTNGSTTAAGGFAGGAGVARDGAGELFVSDMRNARIWEMEGINDTPWLVAGNGTVGYSGDGGASTNAELNGPYALALDNAGNLYIADWGNNVIRKVSSIPPRTTAPALQLDNVSTNAGNYSVIISDAEGSITSSVVTVTAGAPVISSPPQSSIVFAGSAASFGVSAIGNPLSYQWLFNGAPLDEQTNGTLTLSAVTGANAGTYEVVVGNIYGSVTSSPPATLTVAEPTIDITSQPTNQTVQAGSNVMFTVTVSGNGPFTFRWQKNGSNLSHQPEGTITTVAGNGTAGYSGDGMRATNSELNGPISAAVDLTGDLFIADTSNNRIRKVDPAGIISTLAGNGSSVGNLNTYPNGGNGNPATNTAFGVPIGVAVNSKGWFYVADCVLGRVQVVSNGIMETAAGANNPMGVMVDSADNLFIADAGASVIRKVDTSGVMTIVAGNRTAGFSGDGGAATNASINWPVGMVEDSAGDLFIADSSNNRIRKVDTNGIITTVAGNGLGYYYGDGGPATNAEISTPTGVAVDGVGNVFIADQGNSRIREVGTNGIITTIAGEGVGYSGDGGPATQATLAGPIGLAMDSVDDLFIVDKGNNAIRKVIVPQGPSLLLTHVTSANAGNYQVIATGPAGSVTSSVVTLTVLDPPVIMTEPTNQSAFVGQPVSFNVAAQGGSPMNYQWMFNGTNVAGETKAVLTLPAVSAINAGAYSVIVSNVFGCVTSSPSATLAVLPLPTSETINIMPMGDSVTARGGAPESSYRYWLYTYLTNAGFFNTMFVGSQTGTGGTSDGPPANSWPQILYEGGGTTEGLAPIADGWSTWEGMFDSTNAANILNNGGPGATILLLDLGSNDHIPGSGPAGPDLAQMKINLESTIQTFYQINTNTIVLLAVPTPWVINPLDRITRQFMTSLGRAIAEVAANQKKLGVKIEVVNLAVGFNPSQDTKDGTHPNIKGEQMIARKYFNALRPILKKMEKEGL